MLRDPHPSHVTKPSTMDLFVSICINCGVVERASGGWDKQAAEPCPTPVGAGGKTLKEFEEGESQLRVHLKSLPFDFANEDDEEF